MMAGGLQRYGTKQSPACEVAIGTFLDLLRRHPSRTPKKQFNTASSRVFPRKKMALHLGCLGSNGETIGRPDIFASLATQAANLPGQRPGSVERLGTHVDGRQSGANVGRDGWDP